jgi:hypothetical protein
MFATSARKLSAPQGAGAQPFGHRVLSADEIRKMRRHSWERVKLALEQVQAMQDRWSAAWRSVIDHPGTFEASADEIEHWRGECARANDVYAQLDREAQPPPPLHTCERPIIVDNTAEHARLELERSSTHAAQGMTRNLTNEARAELHARERAAETALRDLRLVRQVRLFGVWTVTIWIVDPGAPKGYDAMAVHDTGTLDPIEPSCRFDFAQAARYAGELCGYILT